MEVLCSYYVMLASSVTKASCWAMHMCELSPGVNRGEDLESKACNFSGRARHQMTPYRPNRSDIILQFFVISSRLI